jgi:hypothetical protein
MSATGTVMVKIKVNDELKSLLSSVTALEADLGNWSDVPMLSELKYTMTNLAKVCKWALAQRSTRHGQ